MSGEERLPEEQCRRVGMPGSLRGRRSKEMSRILFPAGVEVALESQMVMAIEVP